MELPLHQQFQDMIHIVLHILFVIIYVYLSINILYLFVIAVAGLFRRKEVFVSYPDKKRIAVLITSYKEDNIIINTVRSATSHNYPEAYYKVFVAADHLQSETISELKKLHATIVVSNSDRSSKARSLNNLLNSIDEKEFDIALVLDADNIMMPGFMEKINAAFQNGYKAVQGHRSAKNKNSSVAVLDALSEEVNNHLFRKAQRALGFSSSLIGSGMAFEFKKLKEVYNKPGILDNPACDREVDFEMMKAGIEIEYLEGASVLDEKVSKGRVYQNQRRRWMESQGLHLKLFFSSNERVEHKTKDYWNKLFINLIPPRLIFLLLLLGMLVIAIIENIFHEQYTGISLVAWVILMFIYCVSLLLAIPFNFYNLRTVRAFFTLPLLVINLLKAAMGLHINRKEFVHTPKSFTGENTRV